MSANKSILNPTKHGTTIERAAQSFSPQTNHPSTKRIKRKKKAMNQHTPTTFSTTRVGRENQSRSARQQQQTKDATPYCCMFSPILSWRRKKMGRAVHSPIIGRQIDLSRGPGHPPKSCVNVLFIATKKSTLTAKKVDINWTKLPSQLHSAAAILFRQAGRGCIGFCKTSRRSHPWQSLCLCVTRAASRLLPTYGGPWRW